MYSCEIEIPETTSEKEYVVESVISGSKRTAKGSFLFTKKAVNIISAKMKYFKKEYDLLANQGKRPVLRSEPKEPFYFEIKVDNKEYVKSIIVINQRTDERQAITCEYDKKTDTYKGVGFGDEIPGTFRVVYHM